MSSKTQTPQTSSQEDEKNGKEYKPRYAKSAEDLIFYTDTDQSNYPIFVLPNFEVVYKKRPEDSKFATFHVKDVTSSSVRIDELKAKFHDILEKYNIQKILEIYKSMKLEPAYRIAEIMYEVYKGDYEELIRSECKGYVIFILALLREEKYGLSKQGWAIAHSYHKRFLSIIKAQGLSNIEKYTYLKSQRAGKWESVFLTIKIPVPTPELAEVFDLIVKYLTAPEEVEEVAEKAEAEIAEEAATIPQVDIEIKPRELEVELEPVSPVATAVATITTPTATPAKRELVKIYLLSMKLPSKYLVQHISVEENREVRAWEGLAADVASRLEGIRRATYEKISRIFAHVEEFGTWIAVSEEAVKEAEEVSKWVREELSKLPLSQVKNVDVEKAYCVRVVPVYLEPEDAKLMLDAAVQRLSRDVEELEKRIAEAEKEQKKSALKRLQQDYIYKQKLLESFKKFISSLS